MTEEITRLFTGQEYDRETGLYYMNARYYAPKISVFKNTDPSIGGLNHYAYGGSNPIKYTDPTGMWLEFIFMAVRALIGAVGSGINGATYNP